MVGVDRGRSPLVALAAAVAVVDAVAPLLPAHRVGIHWPNDVLVLDAARKVVQPSFRMEKIVALQAAHRIDRKLAGILVEVLPDRRHVLGIGLNTNNTLADAPAELRGTAATLRDLAGREFDQTAILIDLLKRLEGEFSRLRRAPEAVAGRANEFCLQLGRVLTLQWADRIVSGSCRGIAADGALLLETSAGTEPFLLGSCDGAAAITPAMTKCYFVSDLHLFANRSNAHQYLEEIARAASHAEVFVLGGDTFDFRWSRIPLHKAVERAVHWLVELTAACPQCHFHLVLGNHDYHQAFIDRLGDLEKQVSNLSWHRYYVRLGNSLFLHGDVANREMGRPDAGRVS